MHDAKNRSLGDEDSINRKVEDLYTKMKNRISVCNNYLFTIPLHRIKSKGLINKRDGVIKPTTHWQRYRQDLGRMMIRKPDANNKEWS
jgi:hypothetical protein